MTKSRMTIRTTDAEHLGRLASSPYRLRSEPLATVAGRSTLGGSWRRSDSCLAKAAPQGKSTTDARP